MTTIGSNIASSSGVGSSEGTLVPTWVSLTFEEHLQNSDRMIRKCNKGQRFDAEWLESVAKVVEAVRMDPFGNIENFFSHKSLLGKLFKGSTPLHWAVLMDDREMVRYILSSGKVDIGARMRRYLRTALSLALEGGNHQIMEDFLEYKVDFVSSIDFANILDGKDSMFGILKKIVANNVNLRNEFRATALHQAAEKGCADVVAYLLNEKADANLVDSNGCTPLYYAAMNGYIDSVAYLLNGKADVNLQTGYSPLYIAAKNGYLDVVTLLLQQNADVNVVAASSETPLYIAAENGHLDVVTLLLQQNADVNAVIGRETVLHVAVRDEDTNILAVLLEHTTVVDVLDEYGMTPLLYTLRDRRFDKSIALIRGGADVNGKDENGNNALHLAIQAHGKLYPCVVNTMDFVKFLQEWNIDANAKNSKGYSPFFAAVVEGHIELVKELLQSKEKINLMEECNGQTAIEIAFDKGHEHIKRMLLECDDVSRYVETLYRDRQVYVDAANAILVGAALIASVTFASWLQPPLGYTTSYLDLAPSSSNINYVDVQHNLSLRAFWIFNTLSFYFGIGTVVFGARSVLPSRHMFIKEVVGKLHQNLLVTSILLACSVFCVIVAFGIAGCIVLTPILKFQWYMIVPTIFGGLVCLVSLGCLFYSMKEGNSKKKRRTYQLYW